jgi:DNA-binding transcriptional regulator GbsR (MarR family)
MKKKGTTLQKEMEFVEEMGVVFDNLGPGRMAGRLLGWLLICDPEHQTSAQLAEKLKASKGSISTVTRFLTQMGFIKRVTIPGERATYFKFTTTSWPELIRRKIKGIIQMKSLAAHGLDILEGARPEQRERLELMKEFYTFMGQEFPAMINRWDDHRKKLKI